jgi:hypothetical protein
VGQLCFLLFVLKLFSCEFFGSWLCLHFYAENYIPVSQMYWDVIIPDADFFCFSKLSLWAVDNFQREYAHNSILPFTLQFIMSGGE